VRALAEKCGVALSGLATGLYWGANACSEDPAVRQKAAAILKKQIECASALGIDAILVVPGAVGVDFIPGEEVVPYGLAYERAKEFIRVAIPAAGKAGVTICIENVWNKFLLSPLEMKRSLIRLAASEWPPTSTSGTRWPPAIRNIGSALSDRESAGSISRITGGRWGAWTVSVICFRAM